MDGETRSSKWILFFLPFITVLREGIEAVVFVGGVSLVFDFLVGLSKSNAPGLVVY